MQSTLFSSRIRFGLGVLTAAALLTGCQKVAQQASKVAQNTVAQVATQILSESDLSGIKDPLVRKNLVAQINAHAFRITTVSARSNSETINDVQFSGTDMRFHMSIMMDGKTTQDMIVIGNTTYIKDQTDGSWWKQVNDTTQASTQPAPAFKMPSINEMKQEFVAKQQNTEFKQVGTEACGSMTCYKYQEFDNGSTTPKRTFWFDNQQFLTRKEETTFGSVTTTNTYTYDNVSVNEPSPTKDVPAGKSIYMYMMGAPAAAPKVAAPKIPTGKMPTQQELDQLMKQAQDAAKNGGQLPQNY